MYHGMQVMINTNCYQLIYYVIVEMKNYGYSFKVRITFIIELVKVLNINVNVDLCTNMLHFFLIAILKKDV